MSIMRLLLQRFSRRRKANSLNGLLQEGPLLKLLVFSGAISRPPHSTHQQSGSHPDHEHHDSVYHNHSLMVEPCLQTLINLPPPFSPVYDTSGLQHNGVSGLLDWGGLLWAVPKKRTSHSKKRMRMAHKYLKPKGHYSVCPNCQNLKLLHILCGHCLKETLRLTAKMRRDQIEKKLVSGLGWGGGGGDGEGGGGVAIDHEQQRSTSETAAR